MLSAGNMRSQAVGLLVRLVALIAVPLAAPGAAAQPPCTAPSNLRQALQIQGAAASYAALGDYFVERSEERRVGKECRL